jgi:hypothetical protein
MNIIHDVLERVHEMSTRSTINTILVGCTFQILVSRLTRELWLYLLRRRYYPSPISRLEYPIEQLPGDERSTELNLSVGGAVLGKLDGDANVSCLRFWCFGNWLGRDRGKNFDRCRRCLWREDSTKSTGYKALRLRPSISKRIRIGLR